MFHYPILSPGVPLMLNPEPEVPGILHPLWTQLKGEGRTKPLKGSISKILHLEVLVSHLSLSLPSPS